jgi:hypothetical protein
MRSPRSISTTRDSSVRPNLRNSTAVPPPHVGTRTFHVERPVARCARMNRPGSGGGSGYWFPTPARSPVGQRRTPFRTRRDSRCSAASTTSADCPIGSGYASTTQLATMLAAASEFRRLRSSDTTLHDADRVRQRASSFEVQAAATRYVGKRASPFLRGRTGAQVASSALCRPLADASFGAAQGQPKSVPSDNGSGAPRAPRGVAAMGL